MIIKKLQEHITKKYDEKGLTDKVLTEQLILNKLINMFNIKTEKEEYKQ